MATSTSSPSPKLLFRQLFEGESSTYTYLLADISHPDKPAVVSSDTPLLASAFLFISAGSRLHLYIREPKDTVIYLDKQFVEGLELLNECKSMLDSNALMSIWLCS